MAQEHLLASAECSIAFFRLEWIGLSFDLQLYVRKSREGGHRFGQQKMTQHGCTKMTIFQLVFAAAGPNLEGRK